MIHSRGRAYVLAGLVVFLVGIWAPVSSAAPEEDESPPFPLHTIEGVGGRGITPTAYLVNPGPEGTVVGKPAVSAQYVMIGRKDLEVLAVTLTLFRQLELGYAVNRLGLHDFPDDVRDATGMDTNTKQIRLHHFNARWNIVGEGAFDRDWMPALTLGAHLKCNNDIADLNQDYGDVLEMIDYDRHSGVDFTLTASKKITALPRPVIVSAGARASRASVYGFLGFSDEYMVGLEGNIAVMVTDSLVIGGEYRQNRETMGRIPDLVERPDPWWDVHVAYTLNPRTNIYALVGNAGPVANHTDEVFYGAALKYEF